MLSMKTRVKLYKLETEWIDCGTGFCRIEQLKDNFYIIIEDEDKILLNVQVISDDVYQLQQDTLIVWTEVDGSDLAISFQEASACDFVWKQIQQIQRRKVNISLENLAKFTNKTILAASSNQQQQHQQQQQQQLKQSTMFNNVNLESLISTFKTIKDFNLNKEIIIITTLVKLLLNEDLIRQALLLDLEDFVAFCEMFLVQYKRDLNLFQEDGDDIELEMDSHQVTKVSFMDLKEYFISNSPLKDLFTVFFSSPIDSELRSVQEIIQSLFRIRFLLNNLFNYCSSYDKLLQIIMDEGLREDKKSLYLILNSMMVEYENSLIAALFRLRLVEKIVAVTAQDNDVMVKEKITFLREFQEIIKSSEDKKKLNEILFKPEGNLIELALEFGSKDVSEVQEIQKNNDFLNAFILCLIWSLDSDATYFVDFCLLNTSFCALFFNFMLLLLKNRLDLFEISFELFKQVVLIKKNEFQAILFNDFLLDIVTDTINSQLISMLKVTTLILEFHSTKCKYVMLSSDNRLKQLLELKFDQTGSENEGMFYYLKLIKIIMLVDDVYYDRFISFNDGFKRLFEIMKSVDFDKKKSKLLMIHCLILNILDTVISKKKKVILEYMKARGYISDVIELLGNEQSGFYCCSFKLIVIPGSKVLCHGDPRLTEALLSQDHVNGNLPLNQELFPSLSKETKFKLFGLLIDSVSDLLSLSSVKGTVNLTLLKYSDLFKEPFDSDESYIFASSFNPWNSSCIRASVSIRIPEALQPGEYVIQWKSKLYGFPLPFYSCSSVLIEKNKASSIAPTKERVNHLTIIPDERVKCCLIRECLTPALTIATDSFTLYNESRDLLLEPFSLSKENHVDYSDINLIYPTDLNSKIYLDRANDSCIRFTLWSTLSSSTTKSILAYVYMNENVPKNFSIEGTSLIWTLPSKSEPLLLNFSVPSSYNDVVISEAKIVFSMPINRNIPEESFLDSVEIDYEEHLNINSYENLQVRIIMVDVDELNQEVVACIKFENYYTLLKYPFKLISKLPLNYQLIETIEIPASFFQVGAKVVLDVKPGIKKITMRLKNVFSDRNPVFIPTNLFIIPTTGFPFSVRYVYYEYKLFKDIH